MLIFLQIQNLKYKKKNKPNVIRTSFPACPLVKLYDNFYEEEAHNSSSLTTELLHAKTEFLRTTHNSDYLIPKENKTAFVEERKK